MKLNNIFVGAGRDRGEIDAGSGARSGAGSGARLTRDRRGIDAGSGAGLGRGRARD